MIENEYVNEQGMVMGYGGPQAVVNVEVPKPEPVRMPEPIVERPPADVIRIVCKGCNVVITLPLTKPITNEMIAAIREGKYPENLPECWLVENVIVEEYDPEKHGPVGDSIEEEGYVVSPLEYETVNGKDGSLDKLRVLPVKVSTELGNVIFDQMIQKNEDQEKTMVIDFHGTLKSLREPKVEPKSEPENNDLYNNYTKEQLLELKENIVNEFVSEDYNNEKNDGGMKM